jgi:hypothetical protein
MGPFGGSPFGITNQPPSPGIGNAIAHGANPSENARAHAADPSEVVARALTERLDSVGRPTDPRLVSAATEHDEHGAPVVRGEIVALTPTPADLAAATGLHFAVARRDDLAALGLVSVTLRVPDGMNAIDALSALRRADPAGTFDYAHIYNPSGVAKADRTTAASPAPLPARDVSVGMIDGGLAEGHAALRGANITIRSFADGRDSPPSAHGTAIASLLVGRDGDFSGHLPGAELYAADVFGGKANGGSALELVRALNWLASENVAVANVSLTGPPDKLLAAAVAAFIAKGHVLVAAVGNDGPAAPANFPASYPGVIAVTSVDGAGHIELDANKTASGFAALGVDVRAANLPQGYSSFTGTSYATPAVTAGFARLVAKPDRVEAAAASDALTRASHCRKGADVRSLCLIPSEVFAGAGKAN